jgi:DNA-binding NtrC family response regulator
MSYRNSGAVRVLAVFATTEDRSSLSQLFRDLSWKAQFVENSDGLKDAFYSFQPDVVMTDCVFSAGGCWKDVLYAAREHSGRLPVIVACRLADERLWAEVLNLGGYDLLLKPFVAGEVEKTVSMACGSQYRSPVHTKLVKHAG